MNEIQDGKTPKYETSQDVNIVKMWKMENSLMEYRV